MVSSYIALGTIPSAKHININQVRVLNLATQVYLCVPFCNTNKSSIVPVRCREERTLCCVNIK
jgi:hypothetical protein